MFVKKKAFQDYKTLKKLLTIELLKEEMFCLEWDLHMLDTSVYQWKDDRINSAYMFS